MQRLYYVHRVGRCCVSCMPERRLTVWTCAAGVAPQARDQVLGAVQPVPGAWPALPSLKKVGIKLTVESDTPREQLFTFSSFACRPRSGSPDGSSSGDGSN